MFEDANRYARPQSVSEACQLLASHQLRVVAGATDVFGSTTSDSVDGLLDISRLERLKQISRDDHEIRIGAGVTWSQLRGAKLPRFLSGLQQAAAAVGSVQIQNRATIGGNVCHGSPAADGVPPLLSLDAELEFVSTKGLRRIRIDDFLRADKQHRIPADELLGTIIIPMRTNSRSTFAKLGRRNEVTIAVVSAAVTIDWFADGTAQSVRISVGAASRVPTRLPELEHKLVGLDYRRAWPKIEAEDVRPLSPISDIRASAQYRRYAAVVLIRRALRQAAEDFADGYDCEQHR